MLRVVDLATGASLSCTLNPQTTTAQVLHAIRIRKASSSSLSASSSSSALTSTTSPPSPRLHPQSASHQQQPSSSSSSSPDGANDYYLLALWADAHNVTRARRLRGEDHPLRIANHLKATVNGKRTPKLLHPEESCHLLVVRETATTSRRDDPASRGVHVADAQTAGFFSILQRLGEGDLCGYFLTSSSPASSPASSWWWVLHGDRMWYYSQGHEHVGGGGGEHAAVSLVNAKLVQSSAQHAAATASNEFELQTPLLAYRLKATSTSPGELRVWLDTIQARIGVCTDNEMIVLADAMVCDEVGRDWRSNRLMLLLMASGATTDTFDWWWRDGFAHSLLMRFAAADDVHHEEEDYALCKRCEAMEKSATVTGVENVELAAGKRAIEAGLFARLQQAQGGLLMERYIAEIAVHEMEKGTL